MSSAAVALAMSDSQRQVLERVARSSTAAHREVVRAKVLLDAAGGVGNKTIAARREVTAVTVRAWRAAFEADGLSGWGRSSRAGAARRASAPSSWCGSWS